MSNKGCHLSLSDRLIITEGIQNGSDKTAIAKTLGKDKSTICLEIKKHRYISFHSTLPLECANYKKCKFKRQCKTSCPDYVKFKCTRRDRSPGACNGCSNYSYCRFTKYKYDAIHAENEYKETLISTREGINTTEKELDKLAEIIVPLIKDKKQSPYVVITNHPELNLTERTLYNYIEQGVFRKYGLLAVNLKRFPKRKPKKEPKCKKRADRKYLFGRTHNDYEEFLKAHPNAVIIQMDTVYNDGSNGPFIQTFKLVETGFMICLYHETKTALDMVEGVDILEKLLQPISNNILVIKTDRGSEFVYADQIEKNKEGIKRFNLFYCDPMCSYQKGSLENNHEEIRYILPKTSSFRTIGLTNQDAMNLVSSHINSFPKEHLKGKTPFETLYFFFPELKANLSRFGVKEIQRDEVNLTPSLLRKFR